MDHSRNIELRLVHYLASVGSTEGRIFGIRDFNAQVMMNAFSEQERDGLLPALDTLVATGVLARVSATEFCLTAEGRRVVREKIAENSGRDMGREDGNRSGA